MSFWGNQQLSPDGNFEIDGGEPIPAGAVLKCIISEAGWSEWQGERKINLTWTVIEGEYKNRRVFQKLDVLSPDANRKNRQLKMLAAIDANAGGGLMRVQGEPTDLDLAQNLTQKIMFIKVSVWEMDSKSGNWVSAVSNGGATQPVNQPAQQIPPEYQNPQVQAAAQMQPLPWQNDCIPF